jgi:hypothetical protein
MSKVNPSLFMMLFIFAITLVVPQMAHAALDLSSFSIDMAPWETLVTTMLGVAGAFFVGKRIWQWANK